MECLGIPIDHRLRRLIRKTQPINANEDSEHVRILQRFGKSLKIKQTGNYYLSTYDLSFGLKLARPESKAGVVVVLLQPHSTQDNSDGFLEGTHTCPTINAVSELISAVTNSRLGLDDISVFDAIPFLDETVNDPGVIEHAQNVFSDMITAKQPNVVISCFRTNSSNPLVQHLRCRPLGHNFRQRSEQVADSSLSLIRVNAFHPSYAINYHPEFSCFKRLLILEFTKAFALWQNRWNHSDWMEHLREECTSQVKEIWKAGNEDGCDQLLKGRLPTLLGSLETGFEECFFSESGFSLVEETRSRFVDSKITWICCDIALVLKRIDSEDLDQNMLEQLLDHFKRWCHKAWPGAKLRRNPRGSNGYYDHSKLLLLRSQQRACANKLENKFYTFLCDLNLSYSLAQYPFSVNRTAQVNAFLTFAAAFENILEEALEETLQNEYELSNRLMSMYLNQ